MPTNAGKLKAGLRDADLTERDYVPRSPESFRGSTCEHLGAVACLRLLRLAGEPAQPRSTKCAARLTFGMLLPHQAQSLQGEERFDGGDFGHGARDQAGVAAGRHDGQAARAEFFF